MQFRFKALQRMREPDELDTPLILAAPRGWVAVFVLLIVLAGAVGWSVLGSLPIAVRASGLLTYPMGTAPVQSPYAGTVRQVLVSPGTAVTAGMPLADIGGPGGAERQIASPFGGIVISVGVVTGEVVSVGTTVATVGRSGTSGGHLVAMLFVPESQSVGVRPGEQVDLAVSTAPSSVYGLLRGRISAVSPYPLTQEALDGLLGGNLATATYARVTAPMLVVVRLQQAASTASGYAWTSTNGPLLPLQSQVGVVGTISHGSQRPISFLFGQ